MKKIDSTAHWEGAKDPHASRAYCQKEDTRMEGPWEFGECNKGRPKTKLKEILTTPIL